MASKTNLKPEQFLDFISSVDQSSFVSDEDRLQAVVGAQALLARLQSPYEKSIELIYSSPYTVASVKTLLDLDLFNIWNKDGAKPLTSVQLGKLTSAEPALLDRLLRMLVSARLLSADNEGRYIFTEFAKGISTGGLDHAWQLHQLSTVDGLEAIPKYLQHNKYRNPVDSNACPFVYHKGMQLLDWFRLNPETFVHLNGLMRIRTLNNTPWFKYYPLDELVQGSDPKDVLLVDVGGNAGHDLQALTDYIKSDLGPGRFVLQDVPEVIDSAKDLHPAITKQAHDFFTEQPVKGARAYFLHSVLHDWSADECEKILKQLKEAMKPGYSRLLINEIYLSLDSSPAVCSSDMHMMMVNAGAERTTAQWRELLGRAGFQISQVYTSPGSQESLIEARV